MEALVGKHDTDDLNNIKFQQTEIDRTDDEINTMKKYLDFDDEADRREAYVPTAGTVAPISSTKLLIAKIAISAVIIAIAFGVVTFFPQLFQFSTNVMINSGILVVGFSALTIVTLGIGFYLK